MNNYHFYEQEAKGKYSVIFKARKKRKLDFVAIKRIQKTRKKKVVNEARILTELSHPNIIKFHDYIESKNHMWAVTEYCPGGDLLKLIEQDKNLPENIVRGFAIEIFRGLQYCHLNNIIICDLKLASILLNEYGKVKIGDFGSAKTLIDLMHNESTNKKGTPSYMAPQLFLKSGVYSFQSDLWSVGCMIYQLAQGTPPFVSSSYQDIATLAHTMNTPKVDDFSSDFNNLLEQLLAKKPQDRISWNQLYRHSWIGNELPVVQMPEQPHFIEYLSRRKQNEGMKFLRASQEFNKQSYSHNTEKADDRRMQFIFEGNDMNENVNDDYDQDYDPEEQIQLNGKEILSTAFMKKKNNADDKRVKNEKAEQPVEDSTNINMFLQAISRKNLIPLHQIIQHQSDQAVKPIIGNKDIEVLQSFNFNKNALGFQYIDPETLAEGIINQEMKSELGAIFDGMIGEEKYNVMGYFQSIIQNSDVANYLFKQEFIKFYMRLMKGYKQANLRAKMFEIMGFLIRHATVIDPKILKHGIINAFLEGATKDKSEKVRRKAMAALGELLFYGATQVDEQIKQWDFSLNLIHSLLKILKNTQEDEIVRIYCCKSIENITAQAKQIGLKFAQIDILIVLINSYNTTSSQGFRTSIACCLHHIMELNTSLREIFLEKIGMENMLETFKNPDSSSKNLQIFLWILLSQFNKSLTNKISKSYLDEQSLFKHILHRLDSTTSSVVKGRIYLYISLFLQSNPKKSILLLENTNMIAINSSKLFSALEKQHSHSGNAEKQNKYETQCIHYVLVWLQENYPNIIKYVHEDIKKIIIKLEGGYTVLSSKKSTGYCGLLWHMVNCPIFQQLFASQGNIEALFSILSLLDSVPRLETISDESIARDGCIGNLESIKNVYMQILQKITNNSSITEKLQDYYASKALPFFVGRILKSVHADIKFNCMKFFLYLVSYYMNEDYIYDSTILSTTSSKITSLINHHLFPEIDLIFDKVNGEVVSTMAMKLVAILFDINQVFAHRFYQLKKINIIIDSGYYKENVNVNVQKVVQKILTLEPEVSHQAVPEWVSKVRVQTFNILASYISTGQEIFLEYPLEILRELLRIYGNNWKQEDIEVVWETILPLQGHEDLIIREKAQNLISKLLSLGRYGKKGRWDIKEKKGYENYEKYLQLSGKPRDPKLTQQFMNKATKNRYL